MANDLVINGQTYSSVEAVALTDSNGNTVQYYPDAVRYVSQELTEDQKSQARANIGVTGTGADGKSAYQYAVDSGYTGTEEEFAKKLAGSSIETNLYDSAKNTSRQYYDTSGALVTDVYGWYTTSDMDVSDTASITYGGLTTTAAAATPRSVFKDAEGGIVRVFLPATGENVLEIPDGAVSVAFTLHMDDVETFYAKIVTRTGIADTVVEGWYAKLGDRLQNLLNKATQKKICCIVDDDTADTDSVNLFKAACDAGGIKGTLASLTYNWKKDSNLKDTLLSMEREGFQIVIHAYSQVDLWNDPESNLAACESNLVQGMQDMQSAGFLDYKYWVTPYCKDTDGIQSMARKWGMKCALAGGNTYEPADDTYGRYALRRAAFGVDDNSSSITLEQLHSIAQDAAGNGGWLIVMTHFETWKSANVDSGTETVTTTQTETVTPAWTEGQYILYTSGTVMENSAYALTDYIDVSGYDTVNVLTKVAGHAGVCLYDGDKQYITGYQPDGLTEIDVSDASYLRVSCWYTSGSFGLEDVVIEGVKATNSGGGLARFTELVDYLKELGYEFMTIGEAWSHRKAIYDLYDMF